LNLLHYSAEPIIFDRNRNYKKHNHAGIYKPHGFWVSVQGDRDWKDWCEAEEFNLESLRHTHTVELKQSANVLLVSTAAEIEKFHNTFSTESNDFLYPTIKWDEVQKQYDGVVIAPYQGAYRLHCDYMWYYGWDCASGCIWNLEAIQDVCPYHEAIG